MTHWQENPNTSSHVRQEFLAHTKMVLAHAKGHSRHSFIKFEQIVKLPSQKETSACHNDIGASQNQQSPHCHTNMGSCRHEASCFWMWVVDEATYEQIKWALQIEHKPPGTGTAISFLLHELLAEEYFTSRYTTLLLSITLFLFSLSYLPCLCLGIRIHSHAPSPF